MRELLITIVKKARKESMAWSNKVAGWVAVDASGLATWYRYEPLLSIEYPVWRTGYHLDRHRGLGYVAKPDDHTKAIFELASITTKGDNKKIQPEQSSE